MWKPTPSGDALMHYAKGQRAKNHKYITIKNGRYVYADSNNKHGGSTSKTAGSSNWQDEIYSKKPERKIPDGKKKRTKEQQDTINRINAAGKKRTKYEQNKALREARQHKGRNRDFENAAKKNARVNRSAANARSHTNAQMIKKNRKQENLVETGLRKLGLNLKLLANKYIPGMTELRKTNKKFKKKKK